MNQKQKNQIQRANGGIIFAEHMIKIIKEKSIQEDTKFHSSNILNFVKSEKNKLLQLKLEIYEVEK